MDTVVVSRLLASKNETESVAAQRLLSDAATAVPAERDKAIALLVAALDKDEQRIRRPTRVAMWFVGVGGFCCAVGAVAAVVEGHKGVVPVVFLPVHALNLMSVLSKGRASCSALRARVALALAAHGDARALGPLIDAWAADRKEAPRPQVTAALNDLLGHVRPGDTGLLNERQRTLHNTRLSRWDPNKNSRDRADEDADGLVALLGAAALVGDASTLAAVRTVADRHPLVATVPAERVIKQARVSRNTLIERLEGVSPKPWFRSSTP